MWTPSGINVMFLALACAALVIRVGLGWHAAGAARAKNAAAAVLRSVADFAVAVLLFWAVGMAILNRSVGYLFDAKNLAGPQQLVQLVLVLIATAPAGGAMMERCRFFPSLAASAILAAVIVPL